jgi:choline kinase
MKAIILAAGVGNRLLPYTNSLPKCLLEIKGHSILEYQINALKKNGIKDIGIVVGHCGDRIRESLRDSVTFIENKDYATTNSSYSLWLAKDFIRAGFIYINSDLLFHEGMLKSLLDSPYENAIIVDKKSKDKSDMFKAVMNGEQILFMDKNIDPNVSSAEVVGPVKFSKDGAEKIIEDLDCMIQNNKKNDWCYKIFSDFAKNNPFFGIKNSGYFWTEIDTPEDLKRAESNIPDNFIKF